LKEVPPALPQQQVAARAFFERQKRASSKFPFLPLEAPAP